MKLSPHEINTPLWSKLTAHYEPILAKHRARLENPKIHEAERLELCWKIAAIKELLAMAVPEQKQQTDAG